MDPNHDEDDENGAEQNGRHRNKANNHQQRSDLQRYKSAEHREVIATGEEDGDEQRWTHETLQQIQRSDCSRQ